MMEQNSVDGPQYHELNYVITRSETNFKFDVATLCYLTVDKIIHKLLRAI